MQNNRAVCSGLPVRGAIALVACVWSLGCSEMKFLVDDFSPGEAKPLTMETVTLRHYKEDNVTSAPLEFMRLHGETAEMAETSANAMLTIQAPEVYFYNMDAPNAQIAYVRATTGVVHLRDDRETSPPAFQSGDIDFLGDVVFLNREAMMRVVTDQLRYSATIRSVHADQLTTRTEATGGAVALDTMTGGFTYNMVDGELTSTEGSQQENLEGPEAANIRRSIHADISAVPWVSGPDDTPIPIPPLPPAQAPEPLDAHRQEDAPLKEEAT